MNRRAVIAAGPLAGLAAALVAGDANAAVVEALTVEERETPVAALFREWSALWAEGERLCDGGDWQETDAEFNAVHDRMIDLERSMMAAPKVSVADIALAIAAATNFGVAAYEDESFKSIQAEARALIG